MDQFLRMYILFEVFRIKNVHSTRDNNSDCRNSHLKLKET
jgi:hypothetical protein